MSGDDLRRAVSYTIIHTYECKESFAVEISQTHQQIDY
jgi:hypothetical protein